MRLSLPVFLCLAFGAAGQAQPEQPLPSVDQLLEKYVQSAGGKAAIEKVTSRVASGTFEAPALGATGKFEQYAKAPDKLIQVIEFEGYGTVRQAFDGKTGWAEDPERGLRQLSGAELERIRRGAALHMPLRMKELYPNMAVKGKEKLGERVAWAIEATPAEGRPEKLYFDAQSGLLVRRDAEAQSQAGPAIASSYFEDFREVDGVKLAHTIRQESPQLSFTIKLTEIKHNLPIDDSRFAKPARN